MKTKKIPVTTNVLPLVRIEPSFMFQVLDLWYQALPHWYTVKDFMLDVKQWFGEGYVDRDIWSHLQKYVKADVLPVSVSDVTVTSGNTVVTVTCSFSGNEGIFIRYVFLLSTI